MFYSWLIRSIIELTHVQLTSFRPRGGTTGSRPREYLRARICKLVCRLHSKVFLNKAHMACMAESTHLSVPKHDDSSYAQSQSEIEAELPTVFDILDVGESYEYVIPSFSCISMTLQHVSVRFVDLGKVATMDTFFRASSDLPGFSKPLPAKVKVISGCLVPVSFMQIIKYVIKS